MALPLPYPYNDSSARYMIKTQGKELTLAAGTELFGPSAFMLAATEVAIVEDVMSETETREYERDTHGVLHLKRTQTLVERNGGLHKPCNQLRA